MSLINSTLLFGMILAVLPVILHFAMRAKPKRVEFPALRLLKARQPSNARRMRLRQWLLLMLRILMIAILVLTLARPSLPAANYSLRWWEWLGAVFSVAAAIALYWWLGRKAGTRSTGSVEQTDRRQRQRVLCLLGGVAAAVLVAGVPWGLRVQAELLSPRAEGAEDIPVAAIFLVDTSLSMKYQHENKTRLEQAATVAREQIGRFPVNSRAAVSGLGQEEDFIFQADLAGAASRLDALEVTAVPRRINQQLKAAIEMQIEDRRQTQEQAGTGGSSDLYAREIYVLSDFSKAAWQTPDESGIADLLAQLDWLQIYFIDVSVQQPINASITGLTLSEETAVAGRDLLLTMSITSTAGLPQISTIETNIINEAGVETRVGAPVVVKLDGNASQVQATVKVPANQPVLEGTVRLTAADPLQEDNVRYFSCGVQPTPKVLLISDRIEESRYLRNALQPEDLELAGVRLCNCRTVVTASAGDQNLSEYDAVFLVNASRPDASLWNALQKYAEDGGGVFLVAGSSRIQPLAWSGPEAKALLPASPLTIVRFLKEPAELQLSNGSHGLVRHFEKDETLRVELAACAFDRCWAVEADPAATVLMRFSGPANRPALLERRIGRGRCMLFTSAMDNMTDGGSEWNNLSNSWSFLVLAEKLLQEMTGASDFRRNFAAGQVIDLPVPAALRFEQFLLRRPGLRQTRGSLPPEQSAVLIDDADEAGHYLVRPFESPSSFIAGFCVNDPDAETDLTRVPDDQLLAIAGPDRATVLHDPSELQRAVRAGRLGVEVFPVLLGLLLILFSAEHLMANFFYDEVQKKPAAA
ncbi:MAG: BatA domain-containing protein [Planctomycetaceae bacterium]|nr:BatA domain-containing protein [Planctomycetaceae bacterium]